MDSLRLILVMVGAVIIVAVYLYSRYRKGSSREFREPDHQVSQSSSNPIEHSASSSTFESMDEHGRTVIVDPSVYSFGSSDSEIEDSRHEEHFEYDDELTELGHDIKINESNYVQDQSIHVDGASDSSIEYSESESQSKDSLVEKVMVIYLLAQPDQEFSGDEITSIADAEGLQFGEDGYFHRYANQNDDSESIFGIANILEPGLFDLSASDDFYTPGLVFFQRLSNIGGALEEFDNMLETVISFRERLDGRLQDSGRRPLNKSALIKLREQVAEFSLANPVTPF